MNELNTKQFNLLSDFDRLCKTLSIQYSLFGKTAAQAYIGKKYNLNYFQVMMTCDDVLKFIESADSLPENRNIRGMFNDNQYTGLTVRYEDSTTSSIEIYSRKLRKIEAGLYVEIIPVRNIDSLDENVKTRFIEQGYEYSQCPVHLVNGIFSKLASLCFKTARLFTNNISAKKYFFKTMKQYAVSGKPYWATREPFRSTRFFETNPLDFLEAVSFLDLENTYYIPGEIKRFLRNTVGRKWSKRAYASERQGLMCFENMSTDQLEKTMKENNLSIRKYKSQRYIFSDAVSRHQDKVKNRAWEIAQMVGRRIELSEYYLPKMYKIQHLIACKDYSRLYRIMNKNRAAVRKYLKIGYGFAVNRELFDIQNQLYLLEGKTELVEKLKKITPESFLK